MEIVREKAKTVIGDAATITDSAGNAVDLQAIYAELNPEQEAVGAEQAPERVTEQEDAE
jgi:trigger factor